MMEGILFPSDLTETTSTGKQWQNSQILSILRPRSNCAMIYFYIQKGLIKQDHSTVGIIYF